MLVFDDKWNMKSMFYGSSNGQRFISCGPIALDDKTLYINNYSIFFFSLI